MCTLAFVRLCVFVFLFIQKSLVRVFEPRLQLQALENSSHTSAMSCTDVHMWHVYLRLGEYVMLVCVFFVVMCIVLPLSSSLASCAAARRPKPEF